VWREEIERKRRRVAEAGDVAEQVAQYDADLGHKRELYQAVRSRLEALEVEGKAPARITIAAEAITPSEPERDRRLLLSVMALGASLMAGVALAYLRISTDPRIREAGDLRRAFSVPFLGELSHCAGGLGASANGDLSALESVRMIRTALLERLGSSDDRVILVTSSGGQAGRTGVAVRLAESMAQVGKRTLLVEADLRRPALAHALGLDRNPGLAGLLAGAVDDDGVVVHTGVANLDVVLAGEKLPGWNSEALANGVFAGSLARWRKNYDLILLDSPPVLPVADARILAGQADGVIMVTRASHCRRADVVEAHARLNEAGGKLLGTVLVRTHAAMRNGYDYEYTLEPQLPSNEEVQPSSGGPEGTKEL
jgi:receptor protein-tyrosine kinase